MAIVVTKSGWGGRRVPRPGKALGRPISLEHGEKKTIQWALWADQALDDRLQTLAKQKEVSKSELMRLAAIAYLESEGL